MKIKAIVLSITVLTLFFTGCSKDEADNTKPVISNLEIGHEGKFQAGAELHIEFEVEDNERLNYYQITIHSEELHKKEISSEWEFDKKYYEINGLKNYTVHNHEIVVPADANLGMYHVYIKVVDEAGNVLEEETELELVLEDLSHE